MVKSTQMGRLAWGRADALVIRIVGGGMYNEDPGEICGDKSL